jgi:hypothetical protein
MWPVGLLVARETGFPEEGLMANKLSILHKDGPFWVHFPRARFLSGAIKTLGRLQRATTASVLG